MNALLQALENRAVHSPEAIALEGSDNSLSVTELLAQVRDIAPRLAAGGYQRVALLADNSPEWIIVDLACQLEGICLVPLPTFFSAEQLAHSLHDAGVDLLIVQSELEAALPAGLDRSAPAFPLLSTLTAIPLAGSQGALLPEGTTKVTFTSGSTGNPKGVCLSFEHCLKVAGSIAEATGLHSPRHLCVLPLAVLLENISGVYGPLLVDGRTVAVPLEQLGFSGSSGLDPAKFLAALHHHRPSTLILVPQLLTLLDIALAMGWTPPDSLQFIAVGGARVAPSLVERVRAQGLPVYEGYGLSECASVVSLNRPGCDRAGTSGRVLNHVRLATVDGQLRVSGNSFLGYLNQPDTWYPDHVDTGDIATVDADGFVTIAGRAKNVLINSYGRNVSPEWIESELAGTGLFSQVVVVGDGRPYCAALLLPLNSDADNVAIQAAIDAVNTHLPDYARVEAWVRLPEALSVEAGTLTNNGRPRRDQIEAAYQHLIEPLYPQTKELIGL